MRLLKALTLLGIMSLAACRHPNEAPRDYEGVRRRAADAHSQHDAQDNRGAQDDGGQ